MARGKHHVVADAIIAFVDAKGLPAPCPILLKTVAECSNWNAPLREALSGLGPVGRVMNQPVKDHAIQLPLNKDGSQPLWLPKDIAGVAQILLKRYQKAA